MIEKILHELGLKEKETKVYLTILEQSKITPARVAGLTGINRSTVYSIVKDLLEKGIIIEDLGNKQTYLIALPPEDLKNLTRKEEQRLQIKKQLVDQAIGELKKLVKDARYPIPKISFIYEEDLEDYLYKQASVWSDNIMKNDSIWWGFQDPSFVKRYADWIDWFWKKCAHKKLSLRLLTSESKAEIEMRTKGYDRRLIKFWDKGESFTATTWVTGDYLILIVTDQKPYYLVQIHDSRMAQNMRELFKAIWEDIE